MHVLFCLFKVFTYAKKDDIISVSYTHLTPDGSKIDGSGAKVTGQTAKNGWVSENGNWHYYENGTMAKDKWLSVSGNWYYVVSDGSMISTTWKEIGGKSYYFGADGAMYVNTTTPDGSKVDENGIKVSVKKNYSHYIGTFCTNEQYNHILSLIHI